MWCRTPTPWRGSAATNSPSCRARQLRPSEASELAAQIIEALVEPFDVRGHQVVIGTSIGIALAPNDGAEPDQLLRNADMALYRAKAEGRGTYHFFQPEMDAQMQERRRLELDLRKALAAEQFELHYQPLVDIRPWRLSRASRRCCAGTTRSAAWCRRTSSFRSPRKSA